MTPAFLTIGDVGLDEYLDEPAPRPGGCALNVAIGLAAGGAAGVAVAGPIGADGEWLREVARARGVDASLLELHPGPSSRQRIRPLPGGERDFSPGYAAGVLLGWRPGPAIEAAARAAGRVYVPAFDHTRALAERAWALAPGRVVVDLMNLTDHDDAFVEEALRRSAVVLCGLTREPRHAPVIERLAELARRPGAALLVVTLGPDGALAQLGPERVEVAAPPVPGGVVVDTCGCGDAFAGGLLAARARGEPLEAALRAGGRLAAVVASHRGAVAWAQGS